MRLITAVERGSSAQKAGLFAGDRLISINGEQIGDILDYMFFSSERDITLVYEREGASHAARIKKNEDDELGLIFETGLMDQKKSCRNKCVFCFVDQLPKGMRETLYFKDDDERLSFMMGNYVTLTNLSAKDIERIKRMRISPLNISVHATDPELRQRMLGNRRALPVMDVMRDLASAGIQMNCQIVCCPGLNDGGALEKTLTDLASLYPQVPSVSVVPVGLTRHRQGLFPLVPVDFVSANDILNITESVGSTCLKTCGSRVVYPADELFIKAGRAIPDVGYYEDFPQLENGVGMLALLADDFEYAYDVKKAEPTGRLTLVTGAAASPFIRALAEKTGADARVIPIDNDFFGRTIDVTGLVCACDIINQLKGMELGTLIIPDTMLRDGNDRFLDDLTPADVGEALGCPVRVVGSTGEHLARLLMGKE